MLAFADRPLVYVAGPYQRPDPVENTHNTIRVADRLHESGLVTCHVPHLTLLWHAIVPHSDPDYWYTYDFAVLSRCDALLRLPGDSTGADNEVDFALERVGIPVFHDEDHLLSWAFVRCTGMVEAAAE